MSIARALRIARAARGLSQKELARRARVAASYVSRIEQGDRIPRRETVESLASALGVPVEVLDLLAAPAEQLRSVREDEAGVVGSLLLELLSDEEERDIA